MTKNEMETMGFYQESPVLKSNKWARWVKDGWISVTVYSTSDMGDLFNEIYNHAFSCGVEKGKEDKAKEIKKVLNIDYE